MSFLRSMWRSSSKHKKLCEELALANNIRDFAENHEELDVTSDDSVSFAVKYLGNCPIDSARSEEETAKAVRTIISTAKSTKKLQRVSLSISPKGIDVADAVTDENLISVSIYKISYCSADSAHPQVFAFIGSAINETQAVEEQEKNAFSGIDDPNEKLICYAFLCAKRKMAQTVSLTVARSFERAFQIWQNQQFQMENQRKEREKNMENLKNSQETSKSAKSLLIDFNSELENKIRMPPRELLQNTWVQFEDDNSDDFHQIAAQQLASSTWARDVMCN